MDIATLRSFAWAWLALPLTALDWLLAWHRLPARVAMKTGPNGQPLAWADRADAMAFDLKLLAGVALFATALGVVIALAQPDRAKTAAWTMGAVIAFVAGLLNVVLWTIQVP